MREIAVEAQSEEFRNWEHDTWLRERPEMVDVRREWDMYWEAQHILGLSQCIDGLRVPTDDGRTGDRLIKTLTYVDANMVVPEPDDNVPAPVCDESEADENEGEL